MKNRNYKFIRVIAALALIILIMASSGCSFSPSGTQREASLTTGDHNCRFWCIVSRAAPASVIQAQLVTDPNSLKKLSYTNDDGWSVGYYTDVSSEPIVNRGKNPAYSDPHFDAAVAEAASATPHIAVSHVRNCSSGLCDIPNPHPFEKAKNGKYWLMGHNGTIDKSSLLSLIRPDYLAANPPVNGTDQSQWIDSELYFIFILQTLDDYHYDVKPALGHVIQCLCDKIPGTGEQLNFFLTDGTTIWGYRQGKSLYYFRNTSDTPYTVLASQYTSSSPGGWITLSDGQLVTMNQSGAPVIENIKNYFSPASIVVSSPNGGQSWVAGTKHAITWSVTNLTGYVKIELLKLGSPVRTITSGVTAISGSYNWSILTSQPSGSDYRIRITSTSNPTVSDTSDANFTIVHP
jgi:predicted glutamine amidotransferase